MPIIVFGSPKGGCGKSTASVLLGTELARGGAKVVFIDADPNQSLTMWSKAEAVPENIAVVSSPEVKARLEGKEGRPAEGFDEIITSYQAPGTVVIVDLEGIADQLMTDAIAVATLVIAPMAVTTLDLAGVVRMVQQIKRVERLTKRRIEHAVLFNSLRSGAVLGATYKDVLEAVQGYGIKHLKTGLVRRDAYANLFREGGNLSNLERKGNGNVEAAINEASAYAEEVFALLKDAVAANREIA